MRVVFHAPVAALALFALGLGQVGCVTSKKYKMAKEGAPPVRPVGLTVMAAPAGLALQTVIVFRGPGSWKREARWDEYVVGISNRGEQPLVVESVALIDVLGGPQVPGDDPWKLEKLSYTNWDKYGKTGLKLLAGAGVVTLYGASVAAAAVGSFLSGGTVGAGGIAVLNVIPVVALVDITAVAILNHQNKKKVAAEFDRRRLRLPRTIPGGGSVEGSFFFPMTPGPQRLVLKGRAGETPLELVLDLKPLAGLHLKPVKKKQSH